MVEPYIEAVAFIGNNKDILQKIKNGPKLKNINIDEYIENKINKLIYDYDPYNEKEVEKSETYKKNPERIFNYTFTELHKLFGGNIIVNNGPESTEINNEAALEIFNKFANEDKTLISELYYGIKQITKYCQKCKMTRYSYIYQRAILLDLNNNKSDIELEDEIINMVLNDDKKDYCPFCSMERKLKIKKTMIEKPKIMIIVINNKSNVRINYEEYMFDRQYKLIGIETIETPKKRNNLFCLFSKCFKSTQTKNYQFLSYENLEIELDKIQRENPYVLYYKKMDKKANKKKQKEKNFMNKGNINSNEELDKKSNDIKIKKKNKKLKTDIINDNIEEGNINNIKNNMNNKGNDIVLLFNFKESKELYLDTKDNKPFKIILEEFEKKWEIKIQKIMYNDKIIKLNNKPKELGMKDNDKILVLDDISI